MSWKHAQRRLNPDAGRSVASRAIVKRDRAGDASPARPLPRNGLVLLWIVRVGVCLVLMTPLVVTPDVFFPFVVGKALFARSIIAITFAFWAGLVLFHRRHRPSPSWVIIAFAVWLLVSCISAAFGVSPTRSMWSTYARMQGVFDLAHWFAFALMAGSVFKSAGDRRLLLGVNLVFGTAVCATSLANHYDLIDIGLLGAHEGRIGSVLGNPLYLGAYAVINALLGAALFVQTLGQPAGPVVRRIGSGTAGGLCALMVLVNLWVMWLSGTRSAIAGLGGAFAVWYSMRMWCGGTISRVRMAGAIVALMMSAVVLLVVARTTTVDPIVQSSVMLSRLANVPQEPGVRWRAHFAEAGLRAFLDRPALGWGPENFLAAWGRHANADTGHADHAHNKLIEELSTKGVLGLLSYLAIWAAMASVVRRSLGRLSGRDQLHLRIIGGTLAAYFVQSLFQVDNPAWTMQFSLLTAFAMSVEASGRTRESAGGADSPPRPANLRASLDRTVGLLAKPVRAGSALLIALAIVSLVHLNMRIWSAASVTVQAMAPVRPWSDRLDDLSRSIRGFPGLANEPRMHFLRSAAGVDQHSKEDFQRMVALATLEIERGLRTEPHNWLLQARAATFYQMAANRDKKYLDVARRHVDRIAELAPGLPLTMNMLNAQERLEAGGRAVLALPD